LAFGIGALPRAGLDAHFVSEGDKWQELVGAPLDFTFAKLGVATAVLTLVSVVPMAVIDLLRKGAATSFVIVELAWLGFLWILWLATAADTADRFSNWGSWGGCPSGIDLCSQYQAAEAFSFLAWLALMAYWIILFAFAIIAANNGHSQIWFTGVTEADFSAGGSTAGGVPQGGVAYPAQQPQMTGATMVYPPGQPNV
jgi:hypothetical protein